MDDYGSTRATRDAFPVPPSTPTSRTGLEHGQPLREFAHSQIEFQQGLHEAQLEQSHSVLMGIDEDALLWPFRHFAGLPAPGSSLRGWYLDGKHPLFYFSLLLIALARYYAITGDEPTRAKIDRLIAEFAQTVEPSGKIYDAGFNASQYSKLVFALLDAHQLVENPKALDVLSRATDAVIPRFPDAVGRTALGGWSLLIPEAQFHAWHYTGNEIHLELATKYLDREFFDPLSQGENNLANKNALAHMDALNSALAAYLTLGEERYLAAAKNGFAFIEAQSYATGGWGPNECFIPSSALWGEPDAAPVGIMPEIKTLGDSLSRTHHHFETAAGAEAHFKVARSLLRITKESTYGDSIERLMYNTVLGALPPQSSGAAFYNSDYHYDGRKTFFDNYGFIGEFAAEWFAEGPFLAMVAADYRINAYLRDDRGVYVNLFIPSTLRWVQDESQVSLTQTGAYPLGDRLAFTVEASRPVVFDLRLRIPAWAVDPAISVNGSRSATVVEPGTFASLNREWRSGDRIELELPRKLVLQPVDADHPDLVALVHGPLVLFAVTTETPQFTRQQLLSADRENAESQEWRVDVAGRSVRFVPFWAIKYERYSTYHEV